VAPLVNAWGFGPEGEVEKAPSEKELAALGERVGYRLIELDRETLSARKLRPDVVCDVSAMAAGYAVDRIAEVLTALGYDNFMIEVTREVRTEGHNAEGRPWQIAIERPVAAEREIERILPVSALALATSGDYRKYREKDGVRLSHIIDPGTRKPVMHKLASVSVFHRECATADGYATALMVLGPDRGFELAVQEGLAALFVIRDAAEGFIEKTTPAFDARFGAATNVVK
jgi:thiamine biosynthesis lipoprotein